MTVHCPYCGRPVAANLVKSEDFRCPRRPKPTPKPGPKTAD